MLSVFSFVKLNLYWKNTSLQVLKGNFPIKCKIYTLTSKNIRYLKQRFKLKTQIKVSFKKEVMKLSLYYSFAKTFFFLHCQIITISPSYQSHLLKNVLRNFCFILITKRIIYHSTLILLIFIIYFKLVLPIEKLTTFFVLWFL